MMQILSFLFSSTFFYILLGVGALVLVLLLCKAFPEFKPVIKYGALILVLTASGLLGTYCAVQINGYYSASGGIFGKIGDFLGFEVEHSQSQPLVFELKNLSLKSDPYGRYSVSISLTSKEDLMTLDPSKNYGLEINGQPTTSITDTSTNISASYTYNFYNDLDEQIFADTLYVSIALNVKSTDILIYTTNSNSLRFWNAYFRKNGFKLEIKESIYQKNEDVNVQDVEGNVVVGAKFVSSDVPLPVGFSLDDVWTDGINTYCSNHFDHYILNGNSWEEKIWNGDTYFYGGDIWTFNGKVYRNLSYVLDGDTWLEKSFQGFPSSSFFFSDMVWSDGDYAYYSYDEKQFVLVADTWEPKEWKGLTSLFAPYIWTDGVEIYYSSGDEHYVLSGNTWHSKTWKKENSNSSYFYGYEIWTYNQNVYLSRGPEHYILKNGMWKLKTWNGVSRFNGDDIWYTSSNTYLRDDDDSTDYVLNGDEWIEQKWEGCSLTDASNIWTDGNSIYYSDNAYQYVLRDNKWEKKTWNYPHFDGKDIWTFNGKVYLGTSYTLNADTWLKKDMNGPKSFRVENIWTDGLKTYYSKGSQHYIFNGETWEEKSWNGLSSFDGSNIWSDGNNVYYSNGYSQYVLNGETWEEKSWNGLSRFDGSNIWSDGNDVYYSKKMWLSSKNLYVFDHYILNGNSWEGKSWNNCQNFGAEDIWTDGVDIYSICKYSGAYKNFKMLPTISFEEI